MALRKVLDQDLQALLQEAAKKKEVQVKNAAERSKMRLRTLEELHGDASAQCLEEVRNSEEVLLPFLLACRTKSSKMVAVAIGAIQKLVARDAVSPASLALVLRALEPHMESTDESILLKLLQTVVSMISSPRPLHGTSLSRAISICFRLHRSKNSVIRNTSSATLRQVSIMLFDSAAKQAQGPASACLASPAAFAATAAERKEEAGEEAEEARSAIHDAYSLFEDLCRLTGGDEAEWLRTRQISQIFGLELLESILNAHAAFFAAFPVFLSLVKDRACPLVIKSCKAGTSFALTLRTVRLMDCVVLHFSSCLVVECEVFLSRLTGMLRDEKPLWHHTLVLEVFQRYCNRPELLKTVYVNYDMKDTKDDDAKIVRNVIVAIGNFVQSMFDWSSLSAAAGRSANVLGMLNQVEAPQVAGAYVVQVAVEAMAGIAGSCSHLANGGEDGTDATDVAVACAITASSWPPLLGALSLLFSKSKSEEQIGTILDTFFAFTLISCLLEQDAPRDAFVTAIFHASCPSVLQQLEMGSTAAVTYATDDVAALAKIRMRNILAMRMMLRVARELGNDLAAGWTLVLRYTNCLASVIRTPLPPTFQPKVAEEFGVLDKELACLFSYTARLGDPAVQALLHGLCHLHQEDAAASNLPGASPENSFALNKIVEVMSVNVHRIEGLWEILLAHLRATSSVKEANVRDVAVQALARVINVAFSFQYDRFERYHALEAKAGDEEEQDMDSMLYMQNRFLEALEEFSRSPHSDVRHKTLETLYQVLQSSGEIVRQCWPVVLSILMTVAVNNDKPHISDGFSSVTLICTDFLPNLPLDCLALFTTTIGCYGLQSSDINISLTAIGLLFSIADFLRRGTSKREGEEEGEAGEAAERRDRLWLSLFTELKQLGTDHRFEVRSCALRTLYKTLTVHGDALPPATWSHFLWEILVPMVAEINASASAAAADEFDVELGTRGGKAVKLMVHHSRNNAQKQWADTQVISFGGLVSTVRMFFLPLRSLPRFSDFWQEVLSVGVSLGGSGSRELSENATASLKELWLGLATGPAASVLPKAKWRGLLATFHAIAHSMAKMTTPNQEQTLNTLSSAVLAIYGELRTQFADEDVQQLLELLFFLATAPSTAAVRKGRSSTVQQTVLQCFAALPPVSDQLFLATIRQLLQMVVEASGCTYHKAEAAGGSARPLTQPQLAEESTKVLMKLLEDEAGPVVRARCLREAMRGFTRVMLLRFSPEEGLLWKSAATSLVAACATVLGRLKRPLVADIDEGTWAILLKGLEQFLFDKRPEAAGDMQAEEAAHDVALVACLTSYVFPVANIIPLDVLNGFIRLLERGSRQKGRGDFVRACYNGLFSLVALGCVPDAEDSLAVNMDLAQLAVPVLMKRVHDALAAFIEHDQVAGKQPLAREQLEEMVLVLTRLKELELSPSLRVFKATSHASEAFQQSSKRHLLFVFPLLCDCITTSEDGIKEMLKEIFHMAAKEVGLE